MSDYGGGDDEPYLSPFLYHWHPSFNDRYDAEPFTYEDEELEPPPPEDDREDALDEQGQLTADSPSALQTNGIKTQERIVASGDLDAASDTSKAIPPEQRTTTPYMTKYEKARILGTRALQIRLSPLIRFD